MPRVCKTLANVAALIGLGTNTSIAAQDDPVTMRGTLQGWAEQSWLSTLDRSGSAGGLLSDRGILQRFSVGVDDKFHLDQLTSGFTMVENYAWYESDNGARWRGGSITKRDLAVAGEFKVLVPAGQRWSVGVRYHKENSPEADRNAVRFLVSRTFSQGLSAFVEGHVDENKPGSDLEFGVRWKGANGARAMLGVSVLDAFNDLIYLNFDAVSQSLADSTIEYERQPLAARGSVDWPLNNEMRIQFTGGIMRDASLLAYDERIRTDGYRQQERFGFVGGLYEWRPSAFLTAGVYANTVWATTRRTNLSPGVPLIPYTLDERTTEVGAYAIAVLSRRWRFDAWARHTWRPERRVYDRAAVVPPLSPNVDFLLRSFVAQGLLSYRAPSGFIADIGLLGNRARTPRGDGQVPAVGSLATTQYRVRVDFGVRPSSRFFVLIGTATDIDAETGEGRSFGGARGRFIILW